MGNFLINQRIKKIKINKKKFDFFDSLINWDDVHTSYINEGQCSTPDPPNPKINQTIKIIKVFDFFEFFIVPYYN